MAESFVITLYETATVSGTSNVVKLDTTTSALWLRLFDDSNVYVSEHALVSLGNGKFRADVADGRYQLWKSAMPDVTTTNRMDFWHGGETRFKWVSDKDMQYFSLTGNNTLSGTNTFNGDTAFNGDIQLGSGDFIYVTEDATLDSQLPNLGQIVATLESYALINDDNTFEAGTTQTFDGVVVFTGDDPPTCAVAPTENYHLANKEYVDDAVGAISVTPYQESVNVVRLMIGGTQQTNQVYTSYIAALAWALAQPPSSTWKITIDIEGMGNSGATSITMGTSGGVYIDDYININGKNHSIVLIPPDDTVSVSTLGTSKISNLTIYKNDAGADPIFTNIEFNNVAFDLTVNTVTFNTCKFLNCMIKVNTDEDATATFTTCKGTGTTSNQVFGSSTIDGWIKPKADF